MATIKNTVHESHDPLGSMPSHPTLAQEVQALERARIVEALERTGNVQARAARILGITPRQLGYKIRKYQIPA